jgi:precorrin-3B synthase
MSLPARSFHVKGWCPGALRPMQSGDGLIVRIRPRGASVSRAAMQGIADAAERYGNGHIDLTRRANLQIRGVRAETLGGLQETLGALGLLDASAEAESARNILLSPLAGLDPSEILDMRPLATGLAEHLAAEPAARALRAKFGLVLDGGGRLPVSGERADILLVACAVNGRPMIAIARDGSEWRGMVEPNDAVTAVCQIIAGNDPELQPVGTRTVQKTNFKATLPGCLQLSSLCSVVGLGAPFGRLEAGQMRVLSEMTDEVRLSPWRVVYLAVTGGRAADRIAAAAREAGFATEADDPLMRIQACTGRPACHAAEADTRADAGKIARWMAAGGFPGTAHLSGCAKGCASSARADLTLVGTTGGYRLMRNAAARDEGGTFIMPADLPGALQALGGSHG